MSDAPRRGRSGGGRAPTSRPSGQRSRDAGLPDPDRSPRSACSTKRAWQIEENAEIILSEVGIQFNEYPRAIELLTRPAAPSTAKRCSSPRARPQDRPGQRAAEYTQSARNPERNVQIGGKHTVFAPNYGSPFVTDLDSGRRYATIADFENIVKLAYMLPHLHHSGGTVCEPVDVPVNKRHLDMVFSHLKYSDKPLMGSVTAPERAARLRRTLPYGLRRRPRRQDRDDQPHQRQLAARMGRNDARRGRGLRPQQPGVHHLAIHLDGCHVTGELAGLAAQALAEALSGMAFVQLVNPGAPVIFGTFATSMSMATGRPHSDTRGWPGDLRDGRARPSGRCAVPLGRPVHRIERPRCPGRIRIGELLLPTMQAGVNFVLHAAGWIEGGLAISMEKLIMDADQLGMMSVYAKGVDMSENGQAMDAFRTNEHGQHFLGTAHTLANFETAFYRSTNRRQQQLRAVVEDGSLTAAQRANTPWKQMLNDYEGAGARQRVEEEMVEYIANRKARDARRDRLIGSLRRDRRRHRAERTTQLGAQQLADHIGDRAGAGSPCDLAQRGAKRRPLGEASQADPTSAAATRPMVTDAIIAAVPSVMNHGMSGRIAPMRKREKRTDRAPTGIADVVGIDAELLSGMNLERNLRIFVDCFGELLASISVEAPLGIDAS